MGCIFFFSREYLCVRFVQTAFMKHLRSLCIGLVVVVVIVATVTAMPPKATHDQSPSTSEHGQPVVSNMTPEVIQEQDQTSRQGPPGSPPGQLVRDAIHQRNQELEQEEQNLTPETQTVRGNFRNVSAFVHFLLAERDNPMFFGSGSRGIGPEVSAYATSFNGSLQAQENAQERIANRSPFITFFIGGDAAAAANISANVNATLANITQMQVLINQCQSCDTNVTSVLLDQLQEMQQQQLQLQALALQEFNNKGLFGWLFC